ncbi:hypothetical protein V6Z12_D01G166900 [Gossypium hirsutum]
MKNIAFELSLVVASPLITITYCFLNHRHCREPSPHPLKSLYPLSYSNNSNSEPITKKPQSKIKKIYIFPYFEEFRKTQSGTQRRGLMVAVSWEATTRGFKNNK